MAFPSRPNAGPTRAHGEDRRCRPPRRIRIAPLHQESQSRTSRHRAHIPASTSGSHKVRTGATVSTLEPSRAPGHRAPRAAAAPAYRGRVGRGDGGSWFHSVPRVRRLRPVGRRVVPVFGVVLGVRILALRRVLGGIVVAPAPRGRGRHGSLSGMTYPTTSSPRRTWTGDCESAEIHSVGRSPNGARRRP